MWCTVENALVSLKACAFWTTAYSLTLLVGVCYGCVVWGVIVQTCALHEGFQWGFEQEGNIPGRINDMYRVALCVAQLIGRR